VIKKVEEVLTQAELTRIREAVITVGCEQFREGEMLPYRLMAKGSAKEVKGSKVVRGLQLYQLRYNY